MFIYVENDNIIGAGLYECGTETIENIAVTDDVYNSWQEDHDRYSYSDGAIIENPDYEEIKERKRRLELDSLTLTPSDVERALYKAKGMDFEDLKQFISQQLPNIDIKALSIEFRAKDFYRGAEANGMRLFDVIGYLLGYSSDDMDYLFEHKELPNSENPDE